ncbi:MAG: hypothetical protein A3B96_01640 [Candidatus Spechtbacteria bacterium RIFCSPHIGHO2_02_FULL_43_15b]|uniref:Uncharacterized protein n=1 Tax=Candidatus Spechtbacteria bacterium RIFCSPHIGHO2_01_FULL_43_30 TaxID=1802158 RepID=A0A1G2H6S6_9BACT|nr:MAG: hypothetical protein A2827_01340 [Candidatus Spechtbacteria bacterium RIFCSPHIGHO2_01_FULL_43_30]OGZ60462.1 MAG: hypothetical protein A3B96_01640 [Candidatus Spechtbacteria bacterium RIFCSPHIGHO2_02_FULL_43_15b]
MNYKTFAKKFWSVVFYVVFIGGVVFISISSVFVITRYENRLGNRLKYDFFTALQGGGEDLKYGSAEAYEAAEILRRIPPDRLDEDFTDITLLANSIDSAGDSTRTMELIISQDTSKLDRVSAYYYMLEADGTIAEMFRDRKTRGEIRSVLAGNASPEIQGVEKSVMIGWNFIIPWVLSLQFVIFGIYCAICGDFEARDRMYNPLFDLPKGIGSKLSILTTVPGSIPIIVIVILFRCAKVWLGWGRSQKEIYNNIISYGGAREMERALKKLKELSG